MMLALRLGMTLAQLLKNISSTELTEWIAYFELEANDQRAAMEKSGSGLPQTSNVRGIKAAFSRAAERKKG